MHNLDEVPTYDYDYKRYILCYYPEHPASWGSSGLIHQHRLVVENELGRYLEPDEHVHHKNGDQKDNRPENLEVVSPREHLARHGKSFDPIQRFCSTCGVELWVVKAQRKRLDDVYCSVGCQSRGLEKIDWPDIPELENLVRNTNYREAGRRLGVSDNAIRKRLKHHGSGVV